MDTKNKPYFVPSFLSDAVDKIAALARTPLEESQEIITKDIYGRPYFKHNGIPVPVGLPDVPIPDVKDYHSLDAMIAMVKEEALELTFPASRSTPSDMYYCSPKLFVVVDSERAVSCRTSSAVLDYNAVTLYRSRVDIVSSFTAGRKYGHEAFMIALRSQFQPSQDRDYLLNILSSVSSQAVVKSEDNGLGQQVSVNKGICNVQMQPVKSIVKLRPYRTFQEVQQPESEFLVRLSAEEDGTIGIALHEADGGMWRMDARRVIAEYLRAGLADEVQAGKIVVTQ